MNASIRMKQLKGAIISSKKELRAIKRKRLVKLAKRLPHAISVVWYEYGAVLSFKFLVLLVSVFLVPVLIGSDLQELRGYGVLIAAIVFLFLIQPADKFYDEPEETEFTGEYPED